MKKDSNRLRGLILSALVFLPTFTFAASAGDSIFSSNLPLIYISTQAQINADTKVKGNMKVIDNGEGRRNYQNDTIYNYNGNINIKWRGNSSLSFEQKKYTVETSDSAGNDLKVSILGMPEESDWVLLAPYNDISLVRDVFAFNMWNEMGHWGPRTRMCEVFVNGTYMGVYAFSEKIKRGDSRVDIAKLKSTDIADRDLTGGYIVRVDAFDDEDATFKSKVKGIQQSMWGMGNNGEVTWTIYYPKKEDLQTEQTAYIQKFVDDMEQSFQTSNFTDSLNGYAKWINVPSFVDYFIHTELSLNADGFKRSSYFFKDKDKKDGTLSKMEAGPVWDFNLAYGNCNFCNANNVEAWVYEGCSTNPTPVLWTKLTQDPKFMAAVKERYAQLRGTIISQKRINEFFDSYASLLNEAKDRHYAKYSNLFSSGDGTGGWGWGSNNPTAYFAAYLVKSYKEEIDTVKSWFAKRLAFLDRNWGYNGTKVSAPQGYFNIKVQRTDDGLVTLYSDRKLLCVKAFSIGGNLLASTSSDNGSDIYNLDVRTNRKTSIIVACYAADGSFISYKIK